MTDWAVVWLGVIAVSVAIMAVVQIGLIVVGLQVARQLSRTADELKREVRPLVDKAHRVVDDAQRAASLARIQVERLEELLATASIRVDQTMTLVRNAMGGPLRQSYAAVIALKAILAALRQPRRERTASREEEDALFVG